VVPTSHPAPQSLSPDAVPPGRQLLECVVNVSEGRNKPVLDALAAECGSCLLDVHSDADHNRSVFTLAGDADAAERAVKGLARAVVRRLDIRGHVGVHPRFGVLDVVPWVSVEGWPLQDSRPLGPAGDSARRARDRFARWVADELQVPVFLYGPERSLPEVRRLAWRSLVPDFGPQQPHPTAGAVAVGSRPLMVAYNLWMDQVDLVQAKAIAAAVRSPAVRTLAFALRHGTQVSCNLIQPFTVGPAGVWDQVDHLASVARAELVGLLPQAVLDRVPTDRWAGLDLSSRQTIEARLIASSGEK
jgi:glutamate formiminotransferase